MPRHTKNPSRLLELLQQLTPEEFNQLLLLGQLGGSTQLGNLLQRSQQSQFFQRPVISPLAGGGGGLGFGPGGPGLVFTGGSPFPIDFRPQMLSNAILFGRELGRGLESIFGDRNGTAQEE